MLGVFNEFNFWFMSYITLMCGDQINPVPHCKYHGGWCPGSLCHQDISTHEIDYVE